MGNCIQPKCENVPLKIRIVFAIKIVMWAIITIVCLSLLYHKHLIPFYT